MVFCADSQSAEFRFGSGDVISTKLQAKYGLTSFCSFTVFIFGATQLISQIPIFALIGTCDT